MPAQPSSNSAIFKYLASLIESGYFGTIQLSLQHGTIVNIRVEQNLKPSDISTLVRNTEGSNNDVTQFSY